MSHTPGPWIADQPFEGHVANASGRLVCSAMGHYDGEEHTRKENVANARLIAAAPELLAALKAIWAFDEIRSATDCGPTNEGYPSPELFAARAAVEAAIAKAEGR